MIVKGFDNKDYKLSLSTKQSTNPSKYHIRARILLNKLFPNDIVYEEVTLKGSKKFNQKDLYADFLIPSHSILIEVHGEQHYKYNNFFHSSKLDFIQSKARDMRKLSWCQLNDIIYIELPSGESDEQWERRINSRITEY